MIISSFNVNSVRARLVNILHWLKEFNPDVVLLQEIKTEEKNFPIIEFEDIGYNVRVSGEKAHNGVAILSKYPVEDVIYHLPTMMSDNAERYIECLINGHIRIVNIYAPNGNPVGSTKFEYKIKWYKAFKDRIYTLLQNDEDLIIAGDFNAIRNDYDVYSIAECQNDAIVNPQTRKALKELIDLGLVDAYRKFHEHTKNVYTWWGYMAGMFQKNKGMLLDYFLLNKSAESKLIDCDIDINPRGQERPSDHTPIWIKIAE